MGSTEPSPGDAVDTSVDTFLPLKPVDLLVLLALEREKRHGYGIVQDIEAESEGRVRLVPGNLYTVLRRLLESRLIAESSRRPVAGREDVRRRYYRLTALGHEVLVAEGQRLRSLVSVLESRRILSPERAS
jgi:DNA-binding PadR family transcriptional regulator